MDWSAEALYSSTIQAPRRTMALVSRVEKYVEGASTRSWWRQLLRTVVDFRALAHPPIHPSPSLHHYFSRGNRLVERIQYSILATFFNGMIIRGLFVTVVGRGRGKIDRVLVSFGRNYWTSCYRLIAGNNVRVYNLASYLESFICEC